jgi:hypothetical protein
MPTLRRNSQVSRSPAQFFKSGAALRPCSSVAPFKTVFVVPWLDYGLEPRSTP